MESRNEITLQRGDKIKFIVNKDLIGCGKDYIIFEMSEEEMMQLGKLAMDMATSPTIKELSLKLVD